MWRKYVKVGHGSLFQGESGRWNLIVSDKGRTRCRSTGTSDRDEAEERRKEIVEEMRRKRIDELSRIPLIDAWSLFESSPYAERIEAEGLRRRFNAWLGFAVWMRETHPAVSEVGGVTRTMASAYVGHCRDTLMSATVNKIVFRLRGMFDILKEVIGLAVNPFDHIMELPYDSSPRRELSRDEIARLLAAANDMGREYHLLVLMAAYTGLRLGECCSLKWSDVDIRRSVIQFIPGKTRKYANGQLVTVPLHMKLVKALLETPADDRIGPVLPELHRTYSTVPHRLHADIKRMFDAAGIVTSVKRADGRKATPEATFHSLRHSFVSFAANAGVPLESLRSIVGHKTTVMTRHYYHADEDALRMAVASVPVYDSQGNVVPPSTEPVFVTREMRETRLSNRLRDVEALLEQGLISEAECNDACMRIMDEA